MARRRKKTKIPVKALGIGAAALLAIGIFGGDDAQGAPQPTPEPARAVVAAVTEKPSSVPTAPPTATPEPTATPYRIHHMDPQTTVYVSRNHIIHFKPDCSGMKKYTEMTLEKADAAGYKYCEHCG